MSTHVFSKVGENIKTLVMCASPKDKCKLNNAKTTSSLYHNNDQISENLFNKQRLSKNLKQKYAKHTETLTIEYVHVE